MKTIGSVALTPKSNPSINRVSANAPTSPIAAPETASFIPFPTTIPTISRGRAPRASRTPISRVCWLTEYEITPKIPIVASSNATIAKIPINHAGSRLKKAAGEFAIISSNVLTLKIPISGSSARAAFRTAPIRAPGSPVVRNTRLGFSDCPWARGK